MTTKLTNAEAEELPVIQRFDESYFKSGSKSNYQDYTTCVGIVHTLADIVLDTLHKKNIYPRTSYDAGCAYGFIADYFTSKGIDAYGSDISEFAVQNAPASVRGKIIVDSLPNLANTKGQYDLVTCFETLEHIPFDDIEPAIQRMYELVAPGGVLVLMPCTTSGTWFPKDPNDVTHISLIPHTWYAELLSKKYTIMSDIEKTLNSHPTCKSVNWGETPTNPHGRFFVIKKT